MGLTMEDIKIEPDWSPLDILAAVCKRADDIRKIEAERLRELKNSHHDQDDDKQILKREKKLKRPMDEVENIRYYDQQEKRSRTDEILLPMPHLVKNRINQLGKNVKLIIVKEIYKTDASETHNRLSIPISNR